MKRSEADEKSAAIAKAIGPEWKSDPAVTSAGDWRPRAVLPPFEVSPDPLAGLFQAAIVLDEVPHVQAAGRTPKEAVEILRVRTLALAVLCRDSLAVLSKAGVDPRALALADAVEAIDGWQRDVADAVSKAASRLRLQSPRDSEVVRSALLILDKRAKPGALLAAATRGVEPAVSDLGALALSGGPGALSGAGVGPVPPGPAFEGRPARDSLRFVEGEGTPEQRATWIGVLRAAADFAGEAARVLDVDRDLDRIIGSTLIEGGVSRVTLKFDGTDFFESRPLGSKLFDGTEEKFRAAADRLRGFDPGAARDDLASRRVIEAMRTIFRFE